MYDEKMSSYGSCLSGEVSTTDVSQDSGQGARFASIWDEIPLSCGEIIWHWEKKTISQPIRQFCYITDELSLEHANIPQAAVSDFK